MCPGRALQVVSELCALQAYNPLKAAADRILWVLFNGLVMHVQVLLRRWPSGNSSGARARVLQHFSSIATCSITVFRPNARYSCR